MKIGIVNFANQNGRYRVAQERLLKSFQSVGLEFTPYFFTYEKEISPDCPYHKSNDPAHYNTGQVVPYAFKPYAMKRAIDDGCDIVIWADAPVYATKDVNDFIDHIISKGYLFFDNIGYSVGDYTSDKCLEIFKVSREESFNMKMIMACLMGINVHNPVSMEFFNQYFEAAKNGSFIGGWTNDYSEVSKDLRCKGHRHDQSAASIIINKLGLDITRGQDTFFAYTAHKGHIDISDSVCIWSQGM
jgi:hypothetical protein